eukprot:GGOE01029911.1.p2 GENE.GGOE01029911.1~~GGOE01029911.1.p2  ORF type:complete len:244 (-),score=4.22 GGOE01029911.1:82-726(-)
MLHSWAGGHPVHLQLLGPSVPVKQQTHTWDPSSPRPSPDVHPCNVLVSRSVHAGAASLLLRTGKQVFLLQHPLHPSGGVSLCYSCVSPVLLWIAAKLPAQPPGVCPSNAKVVGSDPSAFGAAPSVLCVLCHPLACTAVSFPSPPRILSPSLDPKSHSLSTVHNKCISQTAEGRNAVCTVTPLGTPFWRVFVFAHPNGNVFCFALFSAHCYLRHR